MKTATEIIEFTSETFKVQGEKFRLDCREWVDVHTGEMHITYESWGREAGS